VVARRERTQALPYTIPIIWSEIALAITAPCSRVATCLCQRRTFQRLATNLARACSPPNPECTHIAHFLANLHTHSDNDDCKRSVSQRVNNPQNTLRVILVDDHDTIHHEIGGLLSALDDIELVAQGRTGEEAIALCDQHLPDVVLMDIAMPVMTGIEATKIIVPRHPEIKIIALSGSDDTQTVQQMIAAITRLKKSRNWDLIILDLMLSRGISGFDIFQEIRTMPEYDQVPIIAVSASEPAVAIPKARKLGFSGFISKPVDEELFANQIERVIAGELIWHDGSLVGF
jgi:DNA-binding NarL/FixJ family response regulator